MSTAYVQFSGSKADNTKNGTCTCCGKCCMDTLPLTPLDISRIKQYVRKHKIKPIFHGLNHNWAPPRDDVCPFYDPTVSVEHCKIYPVRPIICKHYICRGYADPILLHTTSKAILEEAKLQPAVKKDLTIFLKPRSLRYTIWPEQFPQYKDTHLIIQGVGCI